MGQSKPIPKNSGRDTRYWELRAVETVDPRSFYGRCWRDLTYAEQVLLIAFATLRMEEKAGSLDDE